MGNCTSEMGMMPSLCCCSNLFLIFYRMSFVFLLTYRIFALFPASLIEKPSFSDTSLPLLLQIFNTFIRFFPPSSPCIICLRLVFVQTLIKDISEQILSSQVIIADVTPPNQNVYFEVGYAYGVGKPIILLAEKGTQLPFDLSAFRTLFYENSIAGKTSFDEGIRRHLNALIG